MTRKHGISTLIMLFFTLLLMSTTLCSCRYVQNRAYDFADVFQLGVGVTAENPGTGMWPPSLGVHIQATEFLNLGASHFSGLAAEWDGRGFFAGPESRTRVGFLPIQVLSVYQDYGIGYENYFKDVNSKWTDRMNSVAMRFACSPAKELDYDFWSDRLHQGAPLFHRGWQYWENVAVEAGICEPFVTHLGIHVRAGVDLSEVMDFALGFLYLDFKHDDLTWEEYEEKMAWLCPTTQRKPASDERRPASDEKIETRSTETTTIIKTEPNGSTAPPPLPRP